MLDGVPSQLNTFPSRTSKPLFSVQAEPMLEVTAGSRNAEGAIVVTESGRVTVVRQLQYLKRPSGIVVNCHGVSNVTDINLEHRVKIESLRVSVIDSRYRYFLELVLSLTLHFDLLRYSRVFQSSNACKWQLIEFTRRVRVIFSYIHCI
jgi:hypothetical protein